MGQGGSKKEERPVVPFKFKPLKQAEHVTLSPCDWSTLQRASAVIRYECRMELGVRRVHQVGHFIDVSLSQIIHRYLGWLDYPRGFHSFPDQKYSTNVVRIADDGRRLFCGAGCGWFYEWDLLKYELIAEWKADPMKSIRDMDLRASCMVSIGLSENIYLWDVTDHCLLSTLTGHTGKVLCVAFNRRGTEVVSGSQDRTLRVWSVDSGKCTRVLRSRIVGRCSRVAFLTTHEECKDSRVVSYTQGNSLAKWDLLTGSIIRSVQLIHYVSLRCSFAVNCTQTLMACASNTRVQVFRLPDMKELPRLKPAVSLTFHPFRPSILAFAHASGSLFIVDVQSEQYLWEQKCFSDLDVRCLIFTPDASRLIVTASVRPLVVFDLVEKGVWE